MALAVSAYSVTNLLGNLFAGFLVDRAPKGLVIGVGLATGGLALALVGGASSIQGLVLGLMLNGAALSVVTPAAYALLSQVLPEDSKAAGMARSGAAIGLAAMLGPPVGGLMADRLGHPAAYLAIGIFLLLVALVAVLTLRKTVPTPPDPTSWHEFWALLTDARLRVAYLGAFTLMFVNGSLVFALPPAIRAMGLPSVLIGGLFSTFALSAMVVFLSPLGVLPRRWGAPRTLVVGAVLLALGIGSLASLSAVPMLFAAMVVYGLGFGLVFPSAIAELVAHVPDGKRGTGFGIFYAVFSLGAIAGPWLLSNAQALNLSPFHLGALIPAILALGVAIKGKRSA